MSKKIKIAIKVILFIVIFLLLIFSKTTVAAIG